MLDQAGLAPTSDADPFCAAYFDNPFPVHAALRDAGPAVLLTRYGIYAIARFADVRAMLLDPATFCSARGVGIHDWARETPWRAPSIILEVDPPEHARTRQVLSRVLSASALKHLRAGFAIAADEMVQSLLDRDEFDAIAELAEAYPLRVFPDAVGLPLAGREHVLPYGGTVFDSFGPRNAYFETAMAQAGPHVAAVARLCERDSLAPGGLGAAIYAAADTGEITEPEAALLVRSLLSAGVDTTVSGIGAAIYCLARHPDQWAKLRADPGLARAAFDEAIRYESPVQTFFRTTTREADVGGTTVPEGAKLLMLFSSANRDPRRWEHPDRYDIARRTAGHVGYGFGIHVCVGMLLARLEADALLEALARRVAAIEIVGDVRRRYNNTLRSLSHLPVRLVAA